MICGIPPDGSAYISGVSNGGDKDGGEGEGEGDDEDDDESEGKNDDPRERLTAGAGFAMRMFGCP